MKFNDYLKDDINESGDSNLVISELENYIKNFQLTLKTTSKMSIGERNSIKNTNLLIKETFKELKNYLKEIRIQKKKNDKYLKELK